MLRTTIGTTTNLTKQLSFTNCIGINSTFSQVVRWIRKPMYLPPAKSKLFRVHQRYKTPPPNSIEILRLFNNYRTYRKSIKNYLMQVVADNRVVFDEEALRRADEEDYIRCVELNRRWNEEVKQIRDQRMLKLEAEEKLKISEAIAAQKDREKRYLEDVENQVRKAKLEAATFITEKNIDQAIDQALANFVNYNVAIDVEGNTYSSSDSVEQNINSPEKNLATN